jgi:hypothetical protein
MWSETRTVGRNWLAIGRPFPIYGGSVRAVSKDWPTLRTLSITAEVLDTSFVKRPDHQLKCEGLPKRNATICVRR